MSDKKVPEPWTGIKHYSQPEIFWTVNIFVNFTVKFGKITTLFKEKKGGKLVLVMNTQKLTLWHILKLQDISEEKAVIVIYNLAILPH